jgi:hypothetical protein
MVSEIQVYTYCIATLPPSKRCATSAALGRQLHTHERYTPWGILLKTGTLPVLGPRTLWFTGPHVYRTNAYIHQYRYARALGTHSSSPLGHISLRFYRGGRLRRSCWALPWRQSSSQEHR